MPITIHCFEPQAKPMRASVDLEPRERVALYVMQDTLTDEARGLRTTILRKAKEHPPNGVDLVFELEPRAGRPGQAATFLVRKVGRHMAIEVIRPDGSRGRVTKNAEVRSGSRFDVTLEDMRTITFGLEVEAGSIGNQRMVGGGTRRSNKMDTALTAGAWLIPTVADTLASPREAVISFLFKIAKKLGISNIGFPFILMSLTMFAGIGAGAFFWYQKGNVEEELEVVQAQLVATEQSRDAAISAESACVDQRRVLTAALDDIETSFRLQAEIAMEAQLARTKATELGGPRMAIEEAVEYDLTAAEGLYRYVVELMKEQRDAPDAEDVAPCLGQEAVLGQDVPRYVLVWNPVDELVCPDDYAAVDAGVDRAGAFGLTTRAAAEFGGPYPPDNQDEPRSNVRWSSSAMVVGFRTIQKAVLQADTGGRPPVAPGQVHAWSLAIWDLYNKMPSPANGGMDAPLDSCVSDLVVQASLAGGNAEPGQPVLPSITGVAAGNTSFRLRPTAGCPWPVGGMQDAAKNALSTIARMGLILEAEAESEG